MITSHTFIFEKVIKDSIRLKETLCPFCDNEFGYVYKQTDVEDSFLYVTNKLNEMAKGLEGDIRLQLPNGTIAVFFLNNLTLAAEK